MNSLKCEKRHFSTENSLRPDWKVIELHCVSHGKLGQVEVPITSFFCEGITRIKATMDLNQLWDRHVSEVEAIREDALDPLLVHLL